MRALRNIHAALVPHGLLVDTQPLSAHPCVRVDGREVGELDMRDWLEEVRAVDARLDETIALGLYHLEHEERLIVVDAFDDGPECLDVISGWSGTRVPPSLVARLDSAHGRVTVEQAVRLRLLRSRRQ